MVHVVPWTRACWAFLALLCSLAPVSLGAQPVTVNFDNPAPSGGPDSFVNGTFQGLNFATSLWRWSAPYSVNPTNSIYFGSATATSRTFSFASAPRVLNSINVYTTAAGTLTLSDGVNSPLTRNVTVGSMQLVTTNWNQAATTINVTFTGAWALGVDDITHSPGGPVDTTAPSVTITAPGQGSNVSGLVTLSADASDNVAVAGVRFYVDGVLLGAEDTFAPYTAGWDTAGTVNGARTLTAVARDGAGNETTSIGVNVVVANVAGSGFGYSLSFLGTGTNDVDRVKIRIDDPATSLPGPPADVGATDFTLEFWLNGLSADNAAVAIQCGANENWRLGNTIVDRDRFNQDRAYGVSIAGGRVAFGVDGAATGSTTICGSTNVLDGQWHHIAVQRRRTDGWMWLFVDGAMQAQADGPDGDISYPDNGIPGNFCGGPCTNSDPFIVIGAEKHDTGSFFPYRGLFDELQISTELRYSANFSRPSTPFTPTVNTVALYHFDEGQDDFVGDSSGAFGGPSNGTRRFDAVVSAPQWVVQTPFVTPPASAVGQWSGVYAWPLVGIHVALLRTGQVLTFDGGADLAIGGTSARVWNPAINTFTPVPNNITDIFCGAHSFLADGRLLVNGGNDGVAYVGYVDTHLFDPVTSSWSRVGNMRYRRWYPTNLQLSDGRVLTVSGTTTCSTCDVLIPEVFDPATNAWTELTGASRLLPLYPFLYQIPDGRVLVPGSDEDPMPTYALDVATQTWTTVDPAVRQGGAVVMYSPGRFMKTGSASDVDAPTAPTVATTYVLDMNQPTPVWRQTQSMDSARGFHNLTTLPDGTVLVTGGGGTTDGVNTSLAVYDAELWVPDTESWTTMAAGQRPRLYHSTALLLPDGRVLSAGGGRVVGLPSIDQPSAEIFSPPYLFRGARPEITAIPPAVTNGETFFVGTTDATDIERVTLVSPGAVTHQVNMQQRFVDLAFERTTGGLNVTMPANVNVVAPGHYMLFLINSRGVPSIASFVQIAAPTAPAPVPVTTGLTPTSTPAGGAEFTLTVNGTNFASGSTVRWNGATRASVFVSATELRATISAADIAAQGSASVTVFTPAPGGGTSNAQTFAITAPPNPVPATTGLVPTSALAGGAALTLTVSGTGFVNGSTVRWNGANRPTTFVSATQLTAAIAAADIANAGTASVTVFSAAPGGGTSNAQTFTITAPNPVPATTSLAPSSATAGGAAFTLTVNGSNFVNGSTVRWNGANRTTAFASATQLTAAIAAADIATAGTASVTVFTGAPGGGTSNAQMFTIGIGGNPIPVLMGTTPSTAIAGSAGFTATINGNSFVNGAVVRWNGANRATTFVSSTQLTATILVGDVANAGTATVTVSNPAPGGGTSAPASFLVSTTGASFFDNFNRADSATIGNSWTEKFPNAFSIAGNEVVHINTDPIDYHDAIVYRPVAEDRRDVEVGIEFRVLAGMSFPQAHARAQRGTLTQADTLDDYLLFVDGFEVSPGRAIIARQQAVTGQFECYMLAIPFPSPLQTSERYRLRFRVTGGGPVNLQGFVERFNGAGWDTFASGSIVHDVGGTTPPREPGLYCDPGSLPPPLTTAGAAGFAKWVTNNEVLDNFHWLDLGAGAPPPNPVPTATSTSPVSALSGGAGFTLTVNGTGFVSGAVVRWNGADRATTFVSGTQLTAAIPAIDVATAGTTNVTVFNPAPGGGVSNALVFTITPSGGTPVGLVAALGFNAGSGTTAADSSGNGNTGTLNATTTWTASGRFGSALVFNGTSSSVTVADTNTLDLTTGMTLEAWVYPTVQPSSWRTIVAKEQTSGLPYFLHAGSSSSNRPATGALIAGTEPQLFGGTRLAANAWVHLAATYDGANQRLFVNGVQVSSRALTGSITVSTGPLRIGGNGVWGEYFQGRIDEVRVYNRALTQAEIQADMNTAVGP
jgi:hypothetical protein